MKKDKLILITDAMRAGCMHEGSYDLGGQAVQVKGAKATLADGTLAGSVLTMNEALRNMIKYTDMLLIQAIYSVTVAPAQKLGINKGELTEGFDADIVLFDENLKILKTFVAGEEKYSL
jgi:N-acetylglucosamine-6-phosphate deacetylase